MMMKTNNRYYTVPFDTHNILYYYYYYYIEIQYKRIIALSYNLCNVRNYKL